MFTLMSLNVMKLSQTAMHYEIKNATIHHNILYQYGTQNLWSVMTLSSNDHEQYTYVRLHGFQR